MTAGRKQGRSVSVCKSAWMMDEVMLAHTCIIEQRMNIFVFWFGMCHDVHAMRPA
jgi:hypothetical protein